MNSEPLISWSAPEHLYREKSSDWYWAVGIVTLALAAVAFIFGNAITGIFVLVAASALVIHASHAPKNVVYRITDRGIMADDTLFPFVSLDSFWIPHDELPPKLLIKSRKTFMPLITMYIDEVDPEHVRSVMLTYIAETEHHEPFLKDVLHAVGF